MLLRSVSDEAWLNVQVLSDETKKRQYDTYGMTGEGFAGASAGAAGTGPFPGASYSGMYQFLVVGRQLIMYSVCLCVCELSDSVSEMS